MAGEQREDRVHKGGQGCCREKEGFRDTFPVHLRTDSGGTLPWATCLTLKALFEEL